jgi:hypothetical protein
MPNYKISVKLKAGGVLNLLVSADSENKAKTRALASTGAARILSIEKEKD